MTDEQRGQVVRAFFDQKALLKLFWKFIGEDHMRANRLELLGYYSNLTIVRNDPAWNPRTRAHFDRIKKVLFNAKAYGERKCFVCGEKATVRHHILQIKNGGNNVRRNIVTLCSLCHLEIHPHLREREIRKADSLYEFMISEMVNP